MRNLNTEERFPSNKVTFWAALCVSVCASRHLRGDEKEQASQTKSRQGGGKEGGEREEGCCQRLNVGT